MSKKKIAALAACVLTVLLLAGCQLALPDKQDETGQLCGMLITFEPLPSPMESGQEFTSLEELQAYLQAQQRIFATKNVDETGAYPEIDYTFDSIDGIRFFQPVITSDNVTYYASGVDESIQDYTANFSDTNHEITAKIAVDIRKKYIFHANPVYMTADEQVYVVQGNSMAFSTHDYPGEWGSTSISETKTLTTNGEITEQSFKVTIKIEGVNTLTRTVLKQMDSADNVISETVITADSIPESVRRETDTAYMILEEHGVDINGQTAITRELLNSNANFFVARFLDARGVAIGHVVALVGPNGEPLDL